MTYKTLTIEVNGKKVDVYFFDVPMMHEQFHEAEELGLEYVYFDAQGNDYWDYRMVFAKKEDAKLVEKWMVDNE